MIAAKNKLFIIIVGTNRYYVIRRTLASLLTEVLCKYRYLVGIFGEEWRCSFHTSAVTIGYVTVLYPFLLTRTALWLRERPVGRYIA